MELEIIKNMINNSTWCSCDQKTVYEFINSKKLSYNGKKDLHYSLKSKNDEIELKIGNDLKYQVEYVNDFILKLYNENESIRITPN